MKDHITRRKVMEAAAAVGALSTGAMASDGNGPDRTSGNTIEYTNLTKAAKRQFNVAQSEGKASLGRPRTSPKQLLQNDFVERNSTVYRLSRDGRLTSRYGGTISPTDADAGSVDAISFSKLSGPARKAFQRGGRVVCRDVPAGYPRELVNNQYVERDGTVYATNPQVRDGILNQLRVEKL